MSLKERIAENKHWCKEVFLKKRHTVTFVLVKNNKLKYILEPIPIKGSNSTAFNLILNGKSILLTTDPKDIEKVLPLDRVEFLLAETSSFANIPGLRE